MLCRLLQHFMMARARMRAQVGGAHADGGAVQLSAQSRARHQRCSRGSNMAQPQQTR
jgi:isopenicillin N synthase-like dioxygenase